MSLKIMLADDHKITREGLRSLIRNEPDMEIISEVEDGKTAVKEAARLMPSVIIMDINMPGLNGIDATRHILDELPKTKVIALSMYSDRQHIIGMLKAGVSGYLLKNCAFDELLQALRAVSRGKRYLSAKVADMVMLDYIQDRTINDTSTVTALTKREREVLQLIAEGFSSMQIASRLHVSEKTVSTHRRKIMEKLNIFNVAGLTKYAVREGLTSLDS